MSDDGLVDPSGIPRLDSGAIRDVAAAMTKIAAAVSEQTGTARTSWGSLSSCLSGPGLDALHTALDGPCQKLDGVADRMRRAASALDTFAEAMDQVRPGLNQARDDAQAFVDQVSGGVWLDVWDTTLVDHYWGPHLWDDPVEYWESKGYQARKSHWGPDVQVKVAWTQSGKLVDQNNDLVSRVNALYATLEDAEADCANTLNSLVTGSCMASVEKYSAQDLDAYTASGQSMPWGSQPYGDPNCFESAGMGAVDFGKGMADGITALFGRDPTTGQWSWDEAGTAWLGMGETLGSLVLSTMPFAPELATLPGSVGDVFRAANEKTTDLLKGLVDYDMWGKDPVRAGTDTLLNIGTFFLPGAGEVAGGIKTSLEAVSATAKAADAAKLAAIAAGGAKAAGIAEHVFDLPGAIAGKALGAIGDRFAGFNFHLGGAGVDAATQAALHGADDVVEGGARHAETTLDDAVETGARHADPALDDVTQAARPDLDDAAATAARRADDDLDRPIGTDDATKPDDPVVKPDDDAKPDDPVVKPDDDAKPDDPAGPTPVDDAGKSAEPVATDAGSGDAVQASDAAAEPKLGSQGHVSDTDPRDFPPPSASQEVHLSSDQLASQLHVGANDPFTTVKGLQPDTVYHVEGRGDFYTNADGKVDYVKTTYGDDKDHLNPDLMNPQPDTTYVVTPQIKDPTPGLNYDHVFVTDDVGRTALFHTDNLGLGQDARDPFVNNSVTRKAGHVGGTGFDGGHTDGSQFGGGTEFVNLTPQAARGVNRSGGQFYQIEQKWADTLKSDGSVTDVTVEIRFPGDAKPIHTTYRGNDVIMNPKPDEYDVNATVNGIRPKKSQTIANVNP